MFNPSNNTTEPDAVYTYDGENRRVKKEVGKLTTIFVFDALGKMIAEYSTEVSITPKVQYVTVDDYENPRIITDASGQVIQRRDYMPFGEELTAGFGNRTADLGYVGNQIRKGYAGKDKDDETGFNYFGERYYFSALGRFTSPDPLMSSGGASNPQSWNRYSYVDNNPIAYIDVNGLLKRDKNGKVITENKRKDTYKHGSGVSSKGFSVQIKTDRGYTIEAFQNSEYSDGDVRLEFNCHGLTFTQGQLVIDNDQVQQILTDDYKEVKYEKGEKPQVGDVVIYYSTKPKDGPSKEGIVHSTTVTKTDGTVDNTEVSGLGGVEKKSSTTNIKNGWRSEKPKFKVFRRKANKEVEPDANERATTAKNANKDDIVKLIKVEKVKLGKIIIPEPLEKMPKRP